MAVPRQDGNTGSRFAPGLGIEWRTAMEEYIGLDVSMKERRCRSAVKASGSGAASVPLIPGSLPSLSESGRRP